MIILSMVLLALACGGLGAFATKFYLNKKHKEESEAELRIRTALVSAASHELRTPLNDILGLLANLKPEYDRLSGRGQKTLDKLGDSSGVLHRLLLDVLEIFDLSNNTITFDKKIFNVTDVIETNIRMIESNLGPDATGLKFIFEEKADIWINADQVRFSQCARALLDQAAYQTKRGTVKVDVETKTTSDSDKLFLRIEVSDDSAGMDQFQADRYFAPDEYEMNPALKGRPASMLAMNLAKGIAELMDGSIRVTSKVANGVTFKWNSLVEIAQAPPQEQVVPKAAPIAAIPRDASHKTDAGQTGANKQKTGTESQLTGANVLIIDDNETNLLVLEAFLESFDPAQILTATGGFQALEIASQVKCDLILTDIQMPDLNGFETAELMRGLGEHYSQVPIIGISAGSKTENIPKCKAVGMNGYVEKPLSKDALENTINGVRPRVQTSILKRAA